MKHKPSRVKNSTPPRSAEPPAKRTRRRSAPSSARIAIIVSRYNETITSRLLDGAIEAYQSQGGSVDELAIFDAPGAFELTALADAAASTGRFDGIIALGCIIKGDTSHDQHIASAVVHGLTNVTIITGIPVALGVLTVNTVQQARDRAGLGRAKHGNKGTDAMNALLFTLDQSARIKHGGDRAASSVLAPRPDKAAAASPAARVRGGR